MTSADGESPLILRDLVRQLPQYVERGQQCRLMLRDLVQQLPQYVERGRQCRLILRGLA